MSPHPRRVTIGSLLTLTVILALAFAAVRSASPMWAGVIFSGAIAALAVATLAAIERRGRARSFARGFALCGWTYLALSCGPWLEHEVGPKLVTTAILEVVYPKVAQPVAGPTWGASTTSTVGFTFPNVPGMGMGSMGGAGMGFMGGGAGNSWTQPQPGRWTLWNTPDQTLRTWTNVGGVSPDTPETYRRIGHSAFSLVFAFLGGMAALWLRDRGERRDATA
jgi:hypothetical protein